MPQNKIIFPIIFLALILILSGCGNSKPREKVSQETTKLYSFAEIAENDNESSCWLLISGRVYDVTKFIASHPGGRAILQGCGQEATQLFSTRPMGSKTDHSAKAKNLLDDYYIGNLKSNEY